MPDSLPVKADPVLDGELIDDTLPQPRRRLGQPGPPPRRRSRQAAKDVLAGLVRSPLRFLGSVWRGVLAAFRLWRRWVSVRDYREAAEQAEKLADKFAEIRTLTLFRWKVTGTVLAVTSIALSVIDLLYGPIVLWTAGFAAAVVLAVFGRRKEGSPGRKAVLSGSRAASWTMDPAVMVEAFRGAKLIGKDETLRVVERARRVSGGWALTVDLPATRKAADVIKNRDALASALAVDEIQLIVDRVRGEGGHAGRVSLWVADRDPYSTPAVATPLLAVPRWDAWQAVPFGRDARGRRVDLPLVGTSLLVAAIPRQGKTFAARLAAAGLILDPHVRLYVADFKAGKDWAAAGQVAHRFVAGDEPEHVLALLEWLRELIGEVQGRYRRMRDLDDVVCPESKVTPAISRDPSLGMPITAVIIDEVQVPLEDRALVRDGDRRVPVGECVGEALTWLAKKGPAAGIVLVLATQRPDSQTIPSGLRAVLGSRFALRVMDWRDSNIVLGEQMNTRGFDSSRLLASHKGVGILRPDGDAEEIALTVRTDYMPNEDWQTICRRGRELREGTGTLSGHAAGEATVDRVITSVPSPVLPDPLPAIVQFLGEGLGGREFVPTSELVEALSIDARAFAEQMSELGCRPTRYRLAGPDGRPRQVRGYLTAELEQAIRRHR
ncbi:FtsK/SpoIIIE domain-containing protein [Amycolatopsis stemonae]